MWPSIGGNVRRYVALAQSRGGARFCTRGALQDYAVITLYSRWQKPWHQEGVPGGSRGRPWRQPQNRLFVYPIVAPRSANDIYRPVSGRLFVTIYILMQA